MAARQALNDMQYDQAADHLQCGMSAVCTFSLFHCWLFYFLIIFSLLVNKFLPKLPLCLQFLKENYQQTAEDDLIRVYLKQKKYKSIIDICSSVSL